MGAYENQKLQFIFAFKISSQGPILVFWVVDLLHINRFKITVDSITRSLYYTIVVITSINTVWTWFQKDTNLIYSILALPHLRHLISFMYFWSIIFTFISAIIYHTDHHVKISGGYGKIHNLQNGRAYSEESPTIT